MLIYKTSGKDIVEKLKRKGITTTQIRRDNILPQSALTKLNNNVVVGIKTIEKLCDLLQCQPGDIIVSIDPDTGKPHGKGRKSS